MFLEFFEEFEVELVLGDVFELEGVVDGIDEVVGEALAHGAEGGIGKRTGDDAAEDGDDFDDDGAYGLLGDFLAERGGDLLYDGVPNGFGERLVGDLHTKM